MPIYQYRCKECGQEKDFLQGINDPQMIICPSCNQPGLEKCVTAARVRLKGSGYYETDEKPKEKQRGVISSDEGPACTPKSSEKPVCKTPAQSE